MKLNLNLNFKKTDKVVNNKPKQDVGSTKPMALFAAAMEEEDDQAAPISKRDLVNIQIMESARKNEKQAIRLQAEALAQGEVIDIESQLRDDKAPTTEVILPQKQTMNGESRYLSQLLKARERRDRDKW